MEKGQLVWIPDEKEGWIEGTFESHDKSYCVLVNGVQKEVQQEPFLKNPPMLEGTEDLTSLSYLHEAAVLHNIKVRYSRQCIYTYSGIVLIAMNPFQRVPMYSQELVRAYSGKRRGELEPHLFAVAEDAFRGMIRDKKNQSIIVSGESGAGKTVSAKYIMRYFATADNEERESVNEVEAQVMATNPILEAFGNAKTTRNDNSSRFGKYIQLLFDDKAVIKGAIIRTYLLERSRITFQPESERNYHVFYQLCMGAPAAERKELKLDNFMDFHYLKQGSCFQVANVDDAEEFENLQKALSTIGISVTTQWKIFKTLSAILHLGEIKFDNEEQIDFCAFLLGVNNSDFKRSLKNKTIITRNEKIVTAMTPAQSICVRDSISKFIYSALFDWLIAKVNESLCHVKEFTNFIGVLDIYGFEHFKRNSFEQFCINYANEKLQQEFNQHVFKLEQEEYVREKIPWNFIEFNDNQPCIALIESKLGILSLLDEESKMPMGTDKGLIQKLNLNFDKKHEYFAKPRFSQTAFAIKHFALQVEYEIDGFLDKNKDTVPDDVLLMFENSEFDFLSEITKKTEKKGKKQTLGSVFKSSLCQLMEIINVTEVQYIRCIKSNSEKKAFQFEPQMVLNQLRACGVLETIRISTMGFPGRWKFSEFIDRYYFLVPSSNWGLSTMKLADLILKSSFSEPSYQIGLTKVFFRAGQLASLEKLRAETFKKRVTLIQKNSRAIATKKQYLTLKKQAIFVQKVWRGQQARKVALLKKQQKCSILIQAHVRMFLKKRMYFCLKSSTLCLQKWLRGQIARKQVLAKRKLLNAILIQKFSRGYFSRKQFAFKLFCIIKLQSSVRQKIARMELKKLKTEAKSINHFQEINFKMEAKLMEMTKLLQESQKDVKYQQDLLNKEQKIVGNLKEKNQHLQITFEKMNDKNMESNARCLKLEEENKRLLQELENLSKQKPKVQEIKVPVHDSKREKALLLEVQQLRRQLESERQKPYPTIRRRYTSYEAWSELDKQMASRKKLEPKKDSVEQMEKMFLMLQQSELEFEILGLIENLKVPIQRIERQNLVFVVHILHVYCVSLWQHGLNSKMDRMLTVCVQTIVEKAKDNVFFWITNLIELDNLLLSALKTHSSGSILVEGERIIFESRENIKRAIQIILGKWAQGFSLILGKKAPQAVIDHQGLTGFTTKTRASVFSLIKTEEKTTIEQLVALLDGVWLSLKTYDCPIVNSVFDYIFKVIEAHSLNDLVMRQSHATWKRGMQIQYNVSRLLEWSDSHCHGIDKLSRLSQSAKLLQFTKSRPENVELYIEEVFEICSKLTPSQISKLLTGYSHSDFENPIPPQIIHKISVHPFDLPNIITIPVPNHDSWIQLPAPEPCISNLYVPESVSLDSPHILKLFSLAK